MIVKELVARLGLDIDEIGFERAEALLHKLHLGYAAFGTGLLGALALGAAGLAAATGNAAVAANRLAQSTGLDLEAVQEFGFAASTAGLSVDEMAVALRKLAKTGVRDVRAAVIDLAEKFHGMPDSASARAEKVRIAIEKFGRSGARLVPLLNKGKEGITELMEEAHALGLVLSKEDVAAGEEFRKNLHTIEATFKGLGFTIGRAVLPVVNRFLQGLNTLIVNIRKGAPWVHDLVLAFKVLAFVLGGVVLAALAANIAEVLVAISWYAALGIAATIAAVKAAAAWLAAAAPAILLVAAFTALLLILDDVRGYLNGEDSLIGELGPKWTAFLDRFLKVDGKDPWWLVATKMWLNQLRDAWAMLTDIEGTFGRVTSALGFDYGGRTSGHGTPVTQLEIMQQHAFHGGTSAHQIGAEPLPASAIQVVSPVSIHIAPSAGATPGAIADEVEKRIDAHHKATLRHAAASIP